MTRLRRALPDLFLVAGLAVLTVGLWQWAPPVALAVLGGLLMAGGLYLAAAERERKK